MRGPNEASARVSGVSRSLGRDDAGRATHSPRTIAAGVVLGFLGLWLMQAPPASGAVLDPARAPGRPEVSRVETKAYQRWWNRQSLFGSLALSDMPFDELQDAAERAWAAGATVEQLRAALFTDAARNLFAGNAAGGEHQPSPYIEYFKNNPTQLGRLGPFLTANKDYVSGPGGTQELLFEQFFGLRESYLASLGLQEVNGRIVDPRAPLLSPYIASLLLGEPAPLPQPAAALNVVAP